jgi:hypothetical protein
MSVRQASHVGMRLSASLMEAWRTVVPAADDPHCPLPPASSPTVVWPAGPHPGSRRLLSVLAVLFGGLAGALLVLRAAAAFAIAVAALVLVVVAVSAADRFREDRPRTRAGAPTPSRPATASTTSQP